MTEIQCDVYKSLKKENLYLYVPTSDGLERVPESLMNKFGSYELALTFALSESRNLAREDPSVVLKNLQDQGYHLQLPPADNRFA